MTYTQQNQDSKRVKSEFNLRHRPAFFNTERAALRTSDRCIKPHFVIMGDNGYFWMAVMTDAMRLERAGFEIVK